MRKIKSIAIVLFALVPILAFKTAGAQTNQGGNGLSVTPTRFEFVIERGASELVDIQIKNVTDRDILAKAFLNDFEPDGNTGNPKLIIDSAEQSSSSIKDFVTGLDDVLVKPGETVQVNVPVQVPEDAAPGAYYGAVRFQSTVPETSETDSENPQVALNASVAVLVLIEVPGDITEKIELSNVGAFLDDTKGSLFTSKPNKVGIEVNNLGNGFSKPFGKVSVSGPWGTGEVLSYELNNTSPKGNVLPNSKRLFLDDLSGVKWPGKYTISTNISHGRGGQILTTTASFWYIPSWLVIVLILLLVGIVAGAYFMYKKYSTKTMKRK